MRDWIRVGAHKSNATIWKQPGQYSPEDRMGNVFLQPDVEWWLEALIGYKSFVYYPECPSKSVWRIPHTWHPVTMNPIETRIHFSNPHHAMMFILTWL